MYIVLLISIVKADEFILNDGLNQYYDNGEDFDEYYDALYNYYENNLAALEQYYETWEQYLHAMVMLYDYEDTDTDINDHSNFDMGILKMIKKKLKRKKKPKTKIAPKIRRKKHVISEEMINGLKVTKLAEDWPCQCSIFNANQGWLWVNDNCVGILSIWLIPENAADAAFDQIHAETWYASDGFRWQGTTFKIDGSTCAEIDCTHSHIPDISACVNLIAGWMGKQAPYQVPDDEFSNHPPADIQPRPVVPK